MNILFLSPSFFPKRGGTEQVIYEVVSRLKSKHKIVILSARLGKEYKPHEIINGVEIYRASNITIKGLHLITKYLSFFFYGLKLHRRYKFDFIHMFHVYEVAGAAILLKKLFRLPLITTLAGWDTYDPVKKIPKRFMPFVRKGMNGSDIITAPSNHLAREGTKQGCQKEIIVIPHGTGMHKKVRPSYKNIREIHAITAKRILLSVQRLHSRKGLDILLTAIPKLVTKRKDIVFVIVGKGPEENNLKKLVEKLHIEPYVVFTGFVADDDLPSYYAAADLFVLPTLYEAFGLVYVDALCFGLPIITTENGGSSDIVTSDNGIVIPPGDLSALTKAIDQGLQTKWKRNKILAGAEKYQWKYITEQYEVEYEKLMTH